MDRVARLPLRGRESVAAVPGIPALHYDACMDEFTFSNNHAAHRYELLRGGVVAAHADYKLQDAAVVLTHTEVQPGNEGKGLGSKLAKFVLDDLRQRGVKIVPQCEFLAGYIARHPQA